MRTHLAPTAVAAAEEGRPDPGDRALCAGGSARPAGRRQPDRYGARLAHAPGRWRPAAAAPEPAQPAVDQAQPLVRRGVAAGVARTRRPHTALVGSGAAAEDEVQAEGHEYRACES